MTCKGFADKQPEEAGNSHADRPVQERWYFWMSVSQLFKFEMQYKVFKDAGI